MPITSIQNGEILLLNSSKSILIRQLVLEALYGEVLSTPNADDSEDVWVVYRALLFIKQNFNKSFQLRIIYWRLCLFSDMIKRI